MTNSDTRAFLSDVAVTRTLSRGGHGGAAVYVTRVAPEGDHEAPTNVLFCPPLAEEQGYARGPLFRVAARLAKLGRSSLVYDPLGHGDSEGDFEGVSLAALERNLGRVARHPRFGSESGVVPLLVGVRLGALVAARAVAERLVRPRRLVLVAPTMDGRALSRQLLRKRVAAEIAQTGAVRRDVDALREALSRGETLEVDGWPFSPALFEDLERARGASELARGAAAKAPVDVVLVGRSPAGGARSPELEAILAARPDARTHVVVSGEFWREERLHLAGDTPELAEILAGLLAPASAGPPSARRRLEAAADGEVPRG